MRRMLAFVPLFLAALAMVSCRSPGTQPAPAPVVADVPPPGTIQIADTNAPEPAVTNAATPRQIIQRAHLRINNGDAEKEFLQLVKGKNTTLSDVATIERLIKEKQAEIADFESALAKSFDIDPNRRYTYDRRTMIIYELKDAETNAPPPVTTNADGRVTPEAGMSFRTTRQLHKQLGGKEEAADFIRLTSSKRLSGQEIDTLSLLMREKQIELAKYDEALLTDFAISRDFMYRYDSKSRTLYQLIPVPEAAGSKPDSPKK